MALMIAMMMNAISAIRPRPKGMLVSPVTLSDVKPWLLYRHYARCIPSVSYAFGLLEQGQTVGVVTYGTPPSAPLRRGICGDEYKLLVLELNRLCINENAPRNAASYLIAASLKLLPQPRVIVSFADTEQGHVGYVYQATNFLYTGLSAKRTNWKIRGREHLHGVSVADISRGHKDRAKFMRERFGEDFYLQDRPRKHRYVCFLGTRYQQRQMRAALRYPVLPYPKGPTRRTFTERLLFNDDH